MSSVNCDNCHQSQTCVDIEHGNGLCLYIVKNIYKSYIYMLTRMHVVKSSNHKFTNVIILRLRYLLIINLIISCANKIFNIFVCFFLQFSMSLSANTHT